MGNDKILHATGCFLITAALLPFLGWWAAAGIAMAVGFAKEIWDSRKSDNYFSWADILADFVGAGSGIGIYFAF